MKENLVCIDSDGCAINTMTIKHVKCFGPAIIEVFHLEKYQAEILKRWDKINLYSVTRGINRFLGLSLILQYINDNFTLIEGLSLYLDWVNNTKVYSKDSLKKYISEHSDLNIDCLNNALLWSDKVNEKINQLSKNDKKCFENVYNTLEKIVDNCDIAIVSSANIDAIKEEWQDNNLDSFVTYYYSQDFGSKKQALLDCKTKGYKHIIMIGDAPSDQKSAQDANVSFYPILVNKESDSWLNFKQKELNNFISCNYSKEVEENYIKQFLANLK